MIRRLYLVCCIFTSHLACLVAEQSTKYALLGQTVKFDPGLTAQPDDILWKHNGNKLVEFNSNEELVFGTFENRITLDYHSAELNVSNLRYEDSGDYAIEAFVNKELKRSFFKLKVIDSVAKPTISCEMNSGSSSIKSGNQATLRCSVEPRQSLMKFEWSPHGNVQLGENFTISLGDKHDDEVYNCTVSNPLTKESTTFTAKECYPKEGSAGLITGVCVAVAVILVILGVVFLKWKRKACFANERRADVENQESPPEINGSEPMGAQREERKPLLKRDSTLPSQQPLRYLTQRDINSQNSHTEDTDSDQYNGQDILCPEKNKDKPTMTPRHMDPTENGKGDANVEEFAEKECSPSDSASVLPGVSDEQSENPKPDLQSSTASEHPGPEKNKEKPPVKPRCLSAAGNNKEDTNDDPPKQLPEHKECDPSDSKKTNDDLSGVSDDQSESPKPDLQSSTASEHLETEKEADEEAMSPSANGVPTPAAPPHLPLTETSPNTSPQDGAGEHKEKAGSDQHTEDTTEKNVEESELPGPEKGNESEDLHYKTEKKKEKPPVAPCPLKRAGNNKENVDYDPSRQLPKNKECDPSDSKKTNDDLSGVSDDQSDNPKPDLQSSTASEHPGPEKTMEKPTVTPQPPNLAGNDKEHTENKDCGHSDSEKSTDVSDDKSENPKPDLQPSTASEQPESKKEEGESEEATRAPANDSSPPVDQPVPPLTQESPNMVLQDGAGEKDKDASSEKDPEETTEKNVGRSDSLSSKEEN